MRSHYINHGGSNFPGAKKKKTKKILENSNQLNCITTCLSGNILIFASFPALKVLPLIQFAL
jgi:hypothetical protein